MKKNKDLYLVLKWIIIVSTVLMLLLSIDTFIHHFR